MWIKISLTNRHLLPCHSLSYPEKHVSIRQQYLVGWSKGSLWALSWWWSRGRDFPWIGDRGCDPLEGATKKIISKSPKQKHWRRFTSSTASHMDNTLSGAVRRLSRSWSPVTTTSHRSTKGILKMPFLCYVHLVHETRIQFIQPFRMMTFWYPSWRMTFAFLTNWKALQ